MKKTLNKIIHAVKYWLFCMKIALYTRDPVTREHRLNVAKKQYLARKVFDLIYEGRLSMREMFKLDIGFPLSDEAKKVLKNPKKAPKRFRPLHKKPDPEACLVVSYAPRERVRIPARKGSKAAEQQAASRWRKGAK